MYALFAMFATVGGQTKSFFFTNKRKRKWVHDENLKRKEFGEFNHLIKHVREDNDKFKGYIRMNSTQFDNVLSLIKDNIEKKNLNYRESISEEQRLALRLRYTKIKKH
ncbi:hypothetical protein ILUMI_15636 [Ignelater luminosus]|uniref:Uncharacterized protein n=1 Tax=Ignelater luminosus TaxID=2038154 RepID=A0A8K0CSI5_IGNLU|nr:hypothetical protein ILUMI_15636 [Ignelater luminosus]